MMTLKHRPRAPLPPEQDGLVQRLDAELRQRASREQAMARAAHDQAQAAAAAKAARAEEHYRKLGLDVGGIAAFHRMLAVEDAAARGVLRHAAMAAAPADTVPWRRDEEDEDGMGPAGPAPLVSPFPGQQQVRLTSSLARQRAVSARGSGNGWFGSGAQAASEPELWHFPWTPPANARYTFWPAIAFRGMYIAQAADDFWTSKTASVGIDFCLHYWQGAWKNAPRHDPLGGGGNVFARGGANVSQCVAMDWEHRPTGAGIHEVPFRAGEPAVISVQVTLRAEARGDGSYAEISAAGDGAFLACRSLVGVYAPGL
jgi:hypothetical protein